jgi:hypothetical protein
MSISEHFRYRNDSFKSDIHVFVSDIGITDVDVGYYRNNRCRCRILPTLGSMSMPTYVGNGKSGLINLPLPTAAGSSKTKCVQIGGVLVEKT